MKNPLKIFLITLIILTQSCNTKNDCEGILCTTPPAPFDFELVDKFTGENLFTNGTFTQNQIRVVNLADQKNVTFTFISENNLNVIVINSIG